METKETQEVTQDEITSRQPEKFVNPDAVIYDSYWRLQDHFERIDKLGQVLETNDEVVEIIEVPVLGGLFRDLARLMEEDFGRLADALVQKGIDMEEEPQGEGSKH